MPKLDSERAILFVAATAYCIATLDYVMVMPLGADFTRDLHVPLARVGVVAAGYSAGAAGASFIGSFFFGRLDRKKALMIALGGLMSATLLAGLAPGFPSLVAARAVAGIFGGSVMSLAFATVTDAVPPQRRGRAFGVMTGGFALAQVFGLPFGLETARLFGWRGPFLICAGLILSTNFAVLFLLPSLPRQSMGLAAGGATGPRWAVILSLAMTGFVLMQVGLVYPNISGYLLVNLALRRTDVSRIFLVGGFIALAGTRAGGLVDRFGASKVMLVVMTSACALYLVWFVFPVAFIPTTIAFATYRLAQTIASLTQTTLASTVPPPRERAKFQAQQTSMTHVALSAGSFLSSRLLRADAASQKLVGMPTVAILAIALALAVVPVAWFIEHHKRRELA